MKRALAIIAIGSLLFALVVAALVRRVAVTNEQFAMSFRLPVEAVACFYVEDDALVVRSRFNGRRYHNSIDAHGSLVHWPDKEPPRSFQLWGEP